MPLSMASRNGVDAAALFDEAKALSAGGAAPPKQGQRV